MDRKKQIKLAVLRYRKRKIVNGLCDYGKCQNKPKKGYKRCSFHLRKFREKYKNMVEEKKNRKKLIIDINENIKVKKISLCVWCNCMTNNINYDGTLICGKCKKEKSD